MSKPNPLNEVPTDGMCIYCNTYGNLILGVCYYCAPYIETDDFYQTDTRTGKRIALPDIREGDAGNE